MSRRRDTPAEPTLFDLPPRGAMSQPRRQSIAADSTVRFCVLGSGSGGNCSVLRRADGSAILIDAGFAPATTRRRMEQAGLGLDDVVAVCLTHLDQDHFRPRWIEVLRQRAIRLYVHQWHLPQLLQRSGGDELLDAGLVHAFDDRPFAPAAGIVAQPIRLQHDQQGTCGFRFHCGSCHVGYATDLGHVPPTLIDHFAGIDLLAIESNYDPMMQTSSTRPFFLKRRIMNGSGHLSNQQAYEAIEAIAQRSPRGRPHDIVLLHRSRDCNHVGRIRRVFEPNPALWRRVTIAEQRRRSRWFTVRPVPAVLRRQGLLHVGTPSWIDPAMPT